MYGVYACVYVCVECIWYIVVCVCMQVWVCYFIKKSREGDRYPIISCNSLFICKCLSLDLELWWWAESLGISPVFIPPPAWPCQAFTLLQLIFALKSSLSCGKHSNLLSRFSSPVSEISEGHKSIITSTKWVIRRKMTTMTKMLRGRTLEAC